MQSRYREVSLRKIDCGGQKIGHFVNSDFWLFIESKITFLDRIREDIILDSQKWC
jgi:hypothetical protein